MQEKIKFQYWNQHSNIIAKQIAKQIENSNCQKYLQNLPQEISAKLIPKTIYISIWKSKDVSQQPIIIYWTFREYGIFSKDGYTS